MSSLQNPVFLERRKQLRTSATQVPRTCFGSSTLPSSMELRDQHSVHLQLFQTKYQGILSLSGSRFLSI